MTEEKALNNAALIRRLKNLRHKWICEARREFRMRQTWTNVESVAKSYGMDITYLSCANELHDLIKELEGK